MATIGTAPAEHNALTASTHVVSRKGTPTWEVAHLFPRQGDWTEEEYLQLGTKRLIEFSDGCLEFLPMPSVRHQLITEFLKEQLYAYVKLAGLPGRPFSAPCPVRLWDRKFREPDVLYVRPDQVHDLDGQPDGTDLAMEVVSKGEDNRKRDLDIKREEYAQAGIPEYWIVDPERNEITVLVLEGAVYRIHGVFGAGTTATSATLPKFEVNVDETFSVGEVFKGRE